jgi:hypothetical protein
MLGRYETAVNQALFTAHLGWMYDSGRGATREIDIDSVASPGAPGFADLRISPTSLQDVLPAIVG